MLRSDYIKELTSYYDAICEASPSYACLGFVSLNVGQKGCSLANSARDLVEAHKNLKNAAQVFIGQDVDPAYVLLALNEYRACLDKSKFKVTAYGKDLFAADLVELLLAFEKRGMAKAVIENMKTPAFKHPKHLLCLFFVIAQKKMTLCFNSIGVKKLAENKRPLVEGKPDQLERFCLAVAKPVVYFFS